MRRSRWTSTLAAAAAGSFLFAGIAFAQDLTGTEHSDRIKGTPDADMINALGGPDLVLARADVSGPDDTAGDTVDGGAGDDTIHVRDGEQDVVTCGDGNDKVFADFKDVVDTSCETVIRKAPKSRDDKGENSTQSPKEDNKEH